MEFVNSDKTDAIGFLSTTDGPVNYTESGDSTSRSKFVPQKRINIVPKCTAPEVMRTILCNIDPLRSKYLKQVK